MFLLMCKEVPVLDVENEKVLNYELLPGILQVEPSVQNINAWCQGRYSLKSNVFGRVQRAEKYPYNSPGEIDKLSGAFSLSDCYWLKTKDSDTFAALSPYFAANWTDAKPIANIYTNGWQSKKWLSPSYLYKHASQNEVNIMRLAYVVGLPVADIEVHGDGIAVRNFTTVDLMYEPADMSKAFYEDAMIDAPLPKPLSVIEKLGEFGELMLAFDAIIGNHDRHLGNFGFLRDSNTGEIIGSAPLFDFDQAVPEIMTNTNLLDACQHKQSVLDLCRKIKSNATTREYIANCDLFLSSDTQSAKTLTKF